MCVGRLRLVIGSINERVKPCSLVWRRREAGPVGSSRPGGPPSPGHSLHHPRSPHTVCTMETTRVVAAEEESTLYTHNYDSNCVCVPAVTCSLCQ